MNRRDLEHVVRAAADVSGDLEIVVVGSQAILGKFPDAPAVLLFSQEADVYPRNRPADAMLIDGALGDGSQFHATFGYYAHGVGPETPKAPIGWESRLVELRVRLRAGRPGHATAWCMEAHDLVLAKCAAGRQRDWEFAREAIVHRLVGVEELLRRLEGLPVPDARRAEIRAALTRAPRTPPAPPRAPP